MTIEDSPQTEFSIKLEEQYRRETENMSVKEAVRSLFAWPALYAFMPDRLKNNFDVAVKAAQQSVNQYKLVPEHLRGDPKFTMAVFNIEKFGSVESTNLRQIVDLLPKKQRKDINVALAVTRLLPDCIIKFTGNPRNNPRVAKQVLKQAPHLLSWFSKDIKKNIDVCLCAVTASFYEYDVAAPHIRQGGQLLEAVYKNSLIDFFAICRINALTNPKVTFYGDLIVKKATASEFATAEFYWTQLNNAMEALKDNESRYDNKEKMDACIESINHLNVELLNKVESSEDWLLEAISKRRIYLLEKKTSENIEKLPRKRRNPGMSNGL